MSRRQHPCPQRCPLPWPEDHCLGCWCLLPLLQRCLQGCLWCQCRPTCCSRTAGTATELNSYPGMLKTYRVHAYSAKWLMPAFMLAALVLNTASSPSLAHTPVLRSQAAKGKDPSTKAQAQNNEGATPQLSRVRHDACKRSSSIMFDVGRCSIRQ